LTAGQIIYLQPKRTKADVGFETHLVREGETMYMISQKYGIKLESLYKLNLMESGTEPAVGKKIKLR
jgi:LysM repeat protein